MYGMYTARIKLPKELPGLWPAYWLVQDQTKCWPQGGEADILEAVGGYKGDAVFGTLHWGQACGVDEWNKDHRQGVSPPPAGSHYSDAFHNFTLHWNKTVMTWSVDGQPYVSRVAGQPASLFIPSWSMFTILNTALSFWAGPQVRVCSISRSSRTLRIVMRVAARPSLRDFFLSFDAFG